MSAKKTLYRGDGSWAAGVFEGAVALAAALRERGVDLDDAAEALDLAPGFRAALWEGSMPLPTPGVVRYDRLAELVDLVSNNPLPLGQLYSWQRDDAATWRSTPGAPMTTVDTDR